jgi:dTDP-4-dehydrorhamnose reductase
MKVLVTGCKGQLGLEISKLSVSFKYNWIFTDIHELDLQSLGELDDKLNIISPDIIINCAAYTNVDRAENESEIANVINSHAVNVISKWTFKNNSKLIHISTDYVFNGKSSKPLNENAETSPINVYGKTKLEGEKKCIINDPHCIIIRTSWLYSSFGQNFVKTMYNIMLNEKSINVINDQIGSPTYAEDLANAILLIIKNEKWIPGIYHYSNEGCTSWFDFAVLIKNLFNFSVKINPINSDQYLSIAKRPKYSLLDKTKIKETYDIKVPYYKESLKKCIKILQNEE